MPKELLLADVRVVPDLSTVATEIGAVIAVDLEVRLQTATVAVAPHPVVVVLNGLHSRFVSQERPKPLIFRLPLARHFLLHEQL
jgi:hypothetical protein